MSKARLKKELLTFSDEQLIELILNAYDSSKEAKAYFEFFLNPDAETLLKKKMEAIDKEARRNKWGYSKARISRIKAEIKSFEGLGVGAEYGCRLRFHALRTLYALEKYLNYTNAFTLSLDKFTGEFLSYARENNLLKEAVEKIYTQIVNDTDCGTESYRRHLNGLMTDILKQFRAEYGINL